MPEDKFSASGTEKIPVRYTLHAGIRLKVNDQFSITPNVLYMRQRTSTETMIGAYAQMKSPVSGTDVLFGLNYRINDAVSPYVGFNYKNFTLGMSYDVNASDLSKVQKVPIVSKFHCHLLVVRKHKHQKQNLFVLDYNYFLAVAIATISNRIQHEKIIFYCIGLIGFLVCLSSSNLRLLKSC
jgi:hypothetical protein